MDITNSGVHPLVWIVALSTVLALGAAVLAVRARSTWGSISLGLLAVLFLVPGAWMILGLFRI